jgi:ABC-type Zn2+ transport system, periplasmic component/surface adhesin
MQTGKVSTLRAFSFAAATLGLLVAHAVVATTTLWVTVSIKPIHSLVSGVMGAVGTPELIVNGAGSPHTYVLRPSEARVLNRSDVVFWVGDELETFLKKPLEALGEQANIVTLSKLQGLKLLPAREGGTWEGHKHDDKPYDEREAVYRNDHADREMDMHIWLDPVNAKTMVQSIVAELCLTDPQHAQIYKKNGERLIARLTMLDRELAESLHPISKVPYIVFHDAYHYLEAHYGLNAVGSITVSPERKPGARRVAEMRDKVKQLGVACIFSEPQFEPTLVRTLIDDTKARTGVLDPVGAELRNGPELYFDLLRGLSASLVKCLFISSG